MDFDYTPEENAFREEVRSFINENLPPKKQRDKNFLNTWLENCLLYTSPSPRD